MRNNSRGNIINANVKLIRIPDNTSQKKSAYHLTIITIWI